MDTQPIRPRHAEPLVSPGRLIRWASYGALVAILTAFIPLPGRDTFGPILIVLVALLAVVAGVWAFIQAVVRWYRTGSIRKGNRHVQP